MTRYDAVRRRASGQTTWSRKTTSVARWLVAGAMILALSPSSAHAQFGRLKKLKEKFSGPDSAARAKDSLEQIAAGVKPESVKVGGKSMLQKGASIVSSANGMLEEKTGISAKDAALAATGIGASSLMAKKLGFDPLSFGAQALANSKLCPQQRAMQSATGGLTGGSGLSGMASAAMSAAQTRKMQRAAMANAGAAPANRAAVASSMAGSPAMAGYSQADIDAILAFQQEMTQLSVAASAGDASARVRLAEWEAVVLKYNPEAQRLSMAASAGDVDAVQRLQRLQFEMMREWSRTGSVKTPAKIK
jgi:hypothetical protein